MHDTRSPNTFLFLGVDNYPIDNWIGYGWIGVACFSDFNKGYRASVIEAYDSLLVTAEVGKFKQICQWLVSNYILACPLWVLSFV